MGKPFRHPASRESAKHSNTDAERKEETESKRPLFLCRRGCDDRRNADGPKRQRKPACKCQPHLKRKQWRERPCASHGGCSNHARDQRGPKARLLNEAASGKGSSEVTRRHRARQNAEFRLGIAMTCQEQVEEEEEDRQAQVKKKEAPKNSQNCRLKARVENHNAMLCMRNDILDPV